MNDHNISCSELPPVESVGYYDALRRFIEQCSSDDIRQGFQTAVEYSSQKYLQESRLRPYELGILITLFILLIIIGTCGSSIIIFIMIRNSRMRTPSNLFILNLALSDLMLCLYTQPFNLFRVLFLHVNWTFGEAMCKGVEMGQATNIFVSAINITAIAMDRLQLIVYPRRHRLKVLAAVGILLGSWLLAALLASPMLAFSTVIDNLTNLNRKVCTTAPLHSESLTKFKVIYGILALVVQYAMPLAIVSYAYIRICIQVKRRKFVSSGTIRTYVDVTGQTEARESRVFNVQSPKPAGRSSLIPPVHSNSIRSLVNDRKSEGVINPITDALPSNELVNRPRPSLRINALLFSVTMTFVLAWLPLHIFGLVMDRAEMDHAIKGSEEKLASLDEKLLPHRVGVIIQICCLICILLSTCINPVLYGWLNRNFNREFRALIVYWRSRFAR